MIRWTCPECAMAIKANDPDAGKKTRCPHCAAVVPIPGVAPEKTGITSSEHFDVELVLVPPGAMQAGLPLNSRGPPTPFPVPAPPITFRCPHCQAVQAIAQQFAGQITNCSQCSLPLQLPVPRALPLENAPPAPPPRVPVRTQPKDTFDFDDQREPMPAVAYDQSRRHRNRGNGVVALVLGLISLLFFYLIILGPVAVCVGSGAMKEDPDDGCAKAGYILGWISTVTCISLIVGWCLFAIVAASLVGSQPRMR